MHEDQVDIHVDVARQLIHTQFPEFGADRVERLPTDGTVNAIFRIGEHSAARFPLRLNDVDETLATLRREAAAMDEFAEHSPVPAPRPVGIGVPGVGFPMPWSVQTWVDGTVATPTSHADSAAFAADLAALVGTLRAVDTAGHTFDGNGRGGDLQDHDEWLDLCFARSEGLLDVPRLREMWTRLRTLPRTDPDTMSHRDLIPANLLVSDDRIVGVLDTGGFGPADPALDLVSAWHLLDHERREIVRAELGSDDVEWARGAAWAFQQAMGLVWYYDETNPGMAALGRSTLQRLIEESGL